ncbi:MAG: hypothetical protein JSR89_17920 [Proteobacteria bacterium]|nr:hypothetical protein [Pseudomonadota bacterium]
MTDDRSETVDDGKNSRWPFFFLFALMWAGMIGTTLNTDPVKPGISVQLIVVMFLLFGVLIFLARARWRRRGVFSLYSSTTLGNLGWHVFLLTGIIFLSYLFFDGVIQMMIFGFHIPVFENGCVVSERDTSLFVWDAMAKGAFKFLASYLHIPAESCPPITSSWTVTTATQTIRWYTALVVVWHVLDFGWTWAKSIKLRER